MSRLDRANMNLRKSLTIVVAAIALTAGMLAPLTTHAAANRPISKLSPSTGTYWGIYTAYGIANREALTGRTFNIEQKYRAFYDNLIDSTQQDDWANGRIPLVTWEPWYHQAALSANEDADIANGVFDSTIISRAQQVKNFGHPIFIRFGHEMNGNWYPWDGSHNNNDPSLYVAAWRHVHDVFAAQGATNAVWVWSPNFNDVPGQAWNHWTNYYPGDAYVDWVGVDGYNWGNTTTYSTWQSFNSVFGNGTSGVYADYAWKKAFMINETSSAESGAPAGQSKGTWINGMAATLQNTFPLIQAVTWFDTTSVSGDKQWPIDTSADSLSAYTAAGQLSYFNPAINWGMGINVTGPIKGKGGKCLDDKSNITTNGNKIQLFTCNGTAAQKWTVNSLTGPIVLRNNYCLDAKGNGTISGTLAQLYTCDNSAGEQWTINKTTGTIINPNSQLCLTDRGGYTNNGNQIDLESCNGSSSQKWMTTLP